MTINAFYFSRSPDLKYSLESDQIRDVILNGKYNHKTIYVFTDAPMWILAKINHRDQDLIGLLDGLLVGFMEGFDEGRPEGRDEGRELGLQEMNQLS